MNLSSIIIVRVALRTTLTASWGLRPSPD